MRLGTAMWCVSLVGTKRLKWLRQVRTLPPSATTSLAKSANDDSRSWSPFGSIHRHSDHVSCPSRCSLLKLPAFALAQGHSHVAA